MRINADFSQRAVVAGDAYEWVPSPLPGVERVMLDRIGGEVARATSIVRYAPGSAFDEHVHGGGEEFLVLDGTFSDAQGDYPAGSYVRNPIDTRHAPWSEGGCTIFVKLQQFAPDDTRQFSVDTRAAGWQAGAVEGFTMLPLHAHGQERVRLSRYAPGARFPQHDHPGGEEVLVLEGNLIDEHGTYGPGSWHRSPPGSEHAPWSETGCLLFVKSGHLNPPIGLDLAD
jgi:anti-sigma factor ChrR (cupin superfamily)